MPSLSARMPSRNIARWTRRWLPVPRISTMRATRSHISIAGLPRSSSRSPPSPHARRPAATARRRHAITPDFSCKVVLVTGGGNGIGAASCRGFAKGGARVAVIDRAGAAANSVAAEIGGGATGHALDVADGAAFARLTSEIAAQAGGIDVLVNSAGTITRQTIAAMPVADWDR